MISLLLVSVDLSHLSGLFCLWECRMSGPHAGCPSSPSFISRRFLVPRRMSGFSPDVRAFLIRRMSGPYPGCPASANHGTTEILLLVHNSAGCPAVYRMSGPACYAGCPAPLFFCSASALFLVPCQAGCPAPRPDVRPAHSLTLQRPYLCSHYI